MNDERRSFNIVESNKASKPAGSSPSFTRHNRNSVRPSQLEKHTTSFSVQDSSDDLDDLEPVEEVVEEPMNVQTDDVEDVSEEEPVVKSSKSDRRLADAYKTNRSTDRVRSSNVDKYEKSIKSAAKPEKSAKQPKPKKVNTDTSDQNRPKKNYTPLIFAAVISLLFSVVGYLLLIKAEDNRLGGYDKIDVYVLSTSVAKGEKIMPSDIVIKTVDTSIAPSDAVRDTSVFVGGYAVADWSAGMICTASMFENLDAHIQGNRELAINIADLKGSLNGTLRTGDIIDLYIVGTDYNSQLEIYRSGQEPTDNSDRFNIGNTLVVEDGQVVEIDENTARNDDQGWGYHVDPNRLTDAERDNIAKGYYEPLFLKVSPTLKNVFVREVYNSEGYLISGNDGDNLQAMSFIITVPDTYADSLLGALIGGRVYAVRHIDVPVSNTESENTENIVDEVPTEP